MELTHSTSIKDSVPARTAQVLMDPLRSLGSYSLYKLSQGRLRPELHQFFGPKEEVEDAIDNVQTTLDGIDARLSGGENFVNNLYIHWSVARDQMEEVVGKKVTEYVLFSKKSGRHMLFAEEGDQMFPILLPGKDDIGAVEKGLFGLGEPITKKDFESESVSREVAIRELASQEYFEGEEVSLRRINSVCNEFELRRHAVFERDGEMFENLRSMGAMSIGELQTVTRYMISSGLSFEDGAVKVDPSYEALWISARVISLGEGDMAANEAQAERELNEFVQQVVYFRAVDAYLSENPEIVRDFYKSDVYLKHRKDFINSHLSAKGRTEEDTARAMLANFCLNKFEGKSATDSPSLKYMKQGGEFISDIGKFLADSNLNIPTDLGDLMASLELNLFDKKVSSSEKARVLKEGGESLSKILTEMWRHKETRKIYESLAKLSPFDLIDDDQKSSKVFRVIIGNLGLSRVPGEGRFTMASYLNKAPYYPEGSEVLPFDEGDALYDDVKDSIKHIFNGNVFQGDPGVESAYESQVARIFTEGSTILKYLSEDPRVPQNVRDFIRTIQNGDELSSRIMERYGSISDQDPQIINRFFSDGFERFQIMTVHRYVTDFVRGVETNLIMATNKSWLERTKRKTVGNWKNYDFSQLPDEVINEAIGKTLADAEHRLDVLNHQTTQRTTLKDKQEMLEKVFGWNTYDMWFLRWEKFWNVWNTLGGAWDCACFMRKPIFNPGTFKQY